MFGWLWAIPPHGCFHEGLCANEGDRKLVSSRRTGKAKWLFKSLLIVRFITVGEDSLVFDVRIVLPEKNIKRHWCTRPAITVRTGEMPKHLLLKELEFVLTALMKILKRMLITAVSILRHCHFREPFGVLASHTHPLGKGFPILWNSIAPCQCFQKSSWWCQGVKLPAGTVVCGRIVTWGISGTEMEAAAASTKESLGEQFSWALSSQEGLVHPVLWKRLRHQKRREKPNITRMVFKNPEEIFFVCWSSVYRINTNNRSVSQTQAWLSLQITP